jgi:hypothetical protein
VARVRRAFCARIVATGLGLHGLGPLLGPCTQLGSLHNHSMHKTLHANTSGFHQMHDPNTRETLPIRDLSSELSHVPRSICARRFPCGGCGRSRITVHSRQTAAQCPHPSFFLLTEAGFVTPPIKLRAFFVALVNVIWFQESARSEVRPNLNAVTMRWHGVMATEIEII